MPGENQTAPSRTSRHAHKDEFTVVEIVRDPDGVIAKITERSRDGRVSFTLAREYESNGDTKETKYLSARHLPAIARLLADLGEKLELAEDRARAKKR